MPEVSQQYIESYLVVRGKLEDRFEDGERTQFVAFNYCDLDNESIEFYNWVSNLALDEIAKGKEGEKFAKSLYFYIIDTDHIDAYHVPQVNGLYVIGISRGLLVAIHNYCHEVGSRLEHVALQNFINVKTLFDGSELAKVLVSVVCNFLIHHEIAHHLQKSAEGQASNENISEASQKPFDEISHMKEWDADAYALTKAIYTIFERYYSREVKNMRTFENLVAFTIAGIYCLFDILSEQMTRPFYIEHGSHPHQMIRVRYLINFLNLFVDNHPKMLKGFDSDRVERLIVSFFIGFPERSSATRFAITNHENSDAINKYCEEIEAKCQENPELSTLYVSST